MTTEERQAIEAEHWEGGFTSAPICAEDFQPWPCDAALLLAALREAESEVARLKPLRAGIRQREQARILAEIGALVTWELPDRPPFISQPMVSRAEVERIVRDER